MGEPVYRPWYLRLAKAYVKDAKTVLLAMGSDQYWVRPGLRMLEGFISPARSPLKLERVGRELSEYSALEGHGGSAAWHIGLALLDIGKCCRANGLIDQRALDRIRRHIEDLEKIKKVHLGGERQ